MKSKNAARLVVMALFLAFLFISSRTGAQIKPWQGGGLHGGRLLEALELSDAQRSHIESLFTNSRENLRSLREQLRERRNALKEAIKNQPFDEILVRSQAQELANLQAELLLARAYLMNQVLSSLTEEQKAKLSELREERRERFRERRERRWGNPEQKQG